MPNEESATVRLRQANWFDTENAKRLWEQRLEVGWPVHLRPFSTLIAAMGNHWHPGCYEAVRAMAQATFEQGYDVTLYEEQDRCYQPYDGLGLMRNLAYMRAVREGYEFLLYVDNDVQPEPDALIRLLHRFVPCVAPIIRYWDGASHGQTLAQMEANQGLAMVTSHVLSFTLFQTAIFLPWATVPFWQDALGADESYHFARLAMAGHRPFVDTDVEVTIMSPPHYPLDSVINRSVNNLGSPQEVSRDS